MARRRNIYDASYQTPLADFLDQLPEYFLRYEQLKLQNKKYDNEQAYRAVRDKESDRRWTLTQQNQIHQRDFDAKKLQLSDELKQISGAPIGQQDALYEKILPIYSAHPELTGIIKTRISANNAAEGISDRHLDIQSKISDYKGMGKSGRFGSYYDMLEDKQELSKLGKEVQGTSYQSLIDADIAKLDGWLEFSKQNADKPMPKNLWEHELDRTNYNQTAQQRLADVKFSEKLTSEIAQERAALVALSSDKESVAYKSALASINQKENTLKSLVGWEDAEGNKIRGRIDESSSTLYGIEQNNKWNPLGGSTQILEDGVFGYEPKTEMKEQDVERYILNNPEQGFDAWMDFITNPSEESENKLNSLIEDFNTGERTASAENIMDDYTIKGDSDYAVVDRAQLPVTDKEEPDTNLAEADDDETEVLDEDKEVEIPAVLGGLKAEGKGKKTIKVEEKKDIIPISEKPKITKPKGKYGSAGGALSDVYDKMVKVRKLEDSSRYTLESKGGQQSYQNALKVSEKLREQLKKDILSIYNPETREFRYPGYAETFSPIGDVVMTGFPPFVKQKQTGTRRVAEGGWTQAGRKIPVGDIMSFIEELFPPQIASN